MTDFIGAKIALFYDGKLVVIQRDNKPGLPFAGMWDFAGGAREGNETPQECVIREVQEELGIALSPSAIIWEKTYPAMHDASKTAFFMVAPITGGQYEAIKFGDEGIGWRLIAIDDFMHDAAVIEPLKGRLRDYLASAGPGTSR